MSEEQNQSPPAVDATIDPEKAARIKARAERDAARAAKAAEAAKAAQASEGASEESEPPKPPSPNQAKLDRIVAIIREAVGEQAIAEAYINERDRDIPSLIIDKNYWYDTALVLRDHPELNLHYLRNVSGIDYETHMEVAYYLINLTDKQDYMFKVKTDRDGGEIHSVTPVWETANWNEREIYDLLGVTFTNHPDLRRIMMPDDWVGHPLRKDYESIDPEV